VFSERCSPSQTAGPIRFTPAPCSIDDDNFPLIDCECNGDSLPAAAWLLTHCTPFFIRDPGCLISHSHYDHQDYNSLRDLLRTRGSALNVLVPLGNKHWFTESGFADDQVSELDWWDEAAIEFGGASRMRIVCTPAQHGSGRGAGDKDVTLWSSWLIERVASEDERYRVFFAGDTGLRFKNENRKPRSAYPVCPAFREISIRYGVPHLLLLPISVGSSLSYVRSFDPFPRAYSPWPRVESPLTVSCAPAGLPRGDTERPLPAERDPHGRAGQRRLRQDHAAGGRDGRCRRQGTQAGAQVRPDVSRRPLCVTLSARARPR
jgi:L-ascorbate metabolism protein UlaG (beta-lactamase superfamily)